MNKKLKPLLQLIAVVCGLILIVLVAVSFVISSTEEPEELGPFPKVIGNNIDDVGGPPLSMGFFNKTLHEDGSITWSNNIKRPLGDQCIGALWNRDCL